MTIAAWFSVAVLSLAIAPASAEPVTADDLYRLAERYCVGPDGDDELTWALAAHDGLAVIDGQEFQRLYLPGARQLRGRSIVRDGVEIRVLTARNRVWGGGGGNTFFKLCWVSATPFDRRSVDRQVQRETGMRGFRQDGARVFGWVPQPDGSQREVDLKEMAASKPCDRP